MSIWCNICSTSAVAPDLREDAGSGGHSAVHHAVENGEQAVQRERLRPQEVVTRLNRRQVGLELRISNMVPGVALLYLFIFLQEVRFLYFTVVLWGQKPRLFTLHVHSAWGECR